jgi:hypothetical protein
MALPSCWQARTRRRISQFQQSLVGQAAQQGAGIRKDPLPRCGKGGREIIDDLAEGCLAGAALDDLDSDLVGLEDAFRRVDAAPWIAEVAGGGQARR